jgi:hypothetical protein
VIWITDRHCSQKEDRDTLKSFAKFVTGILLAVLVASPMFAAVPCQPAVHSKACCGGDECPMMAKTMNSKASSHRGTKDVPQPCCKVESHFLVAVTPQRPPESPLSLAVLREGPAASFAPVVQSLDKALSPVDLQSVQRTQAVLCTFLI